MIKCKRRSAALVETLLTKLPDIARGCDPADEPIMRDALAAMLDNLAGLHEEALKVTRAD